MQFELLPPRPALDLALGQLEHQLCEVLHALAVEGRQQQLALLQVGGLVEQDHRVAPHERFEDARALPRMEHLWRGHQHFLDLIRIGENHEGGLAQQAHRVALAVAGAVAVQEGGRARPRAERLQRRGHPRSGGKLALHAFAPHARLTIRMSISTLRYIARGEVAGADGGRRPDGARRGVGGVQS